MSAEIERLLAFDALAQGPRVAADPAVRRYAVLDAFTDTPLEGNPLAVLTDARGIPAERMQRIARELNLSETVFVLPAQGDGDVRVRIFTPTVELPFAGHPVLGTGVLLGAALGRESVVLETGAGAVGLELTSEGGRAGFGRMRQPLPTWSAYEHERELLAALGLERSGLPVEVYCNGPRHVFVELPDEPAVASLHPDLGALERLGEIGVSCFAGAKERWRTRMFAPGLGVPEDPATGSAAGPLAVHLSRHGRVDFGVEIEIRQGEEIGRPSLLLARVRGSARALESVEVGGSAVIVAAGGIAVG